VLLAAGVYQFTPLKYLCLDKCRSPMSFIAENWRGRNPHGESWRLGMKHGLFCLGCCWSLMLVMFAISAGNVVWMLALAALMGIEKNLPAGRKLGVPVGVTLTTAALVTLVLSTA
jgi:predicted metal-binding membrane protein